MVSTLTDGAERACSSVRPWATMSNALRICARYASRPSRSSATGGTVPGMVWPFGRSGVQRCHRARGRGNARPQVEGLEHFDLGAEADDVGVRVVEAFEREFTARAAVVVGTRLLQRAAVV